MVEIVDVEYDRREHAEDLLRLMDAYAIDPACGATRLSTDARQRLVSDLAARADALSVLAYVDRAPAGLVNAFEGYSTFQAKPIINVHDVTVLPRFRGQGLARRMLERVETIAQQRGCCKLTLEVLSENRAAQSAYERFGFVACCPDNPSQPTFFWEKKLSPYAAR